MKICREELNEIKEEMKKEFPYDEALQQIYIARKIIAKKAEMKGMSYIDYVKSVSRDIEQM